MSTILNAPAEDKRVLSQRVEFFTAAAPPPEAVLAAMADSGFNVTHLYGLTETYGPAVVNDWQSAWDDLEGPARATKKARQGVRYHALEDLTVMDPETMQRVPASGETMGEVMFRGNVVMKGYLKNPKASARPFPGAGSTPAIWVCCTRMATSSSKTAPRTSSFQAAKTSPPSKWKTPCTKHPAVRSAGVVAKPDEKWGETPLRLRGTEAGKTTAEDIIDWCRKHLAHYKVPRHVIFTEIPKTSTGKIQKFKLRIWRRGSDVSHRC